MIRKKPRKAVIERESSESEDAFSGNESDEELQDAFQKGLLKPGLNIEFIKPQEKLNNVEGLTTAKKEIYLDLPWIERLDMINDLAPVAPELAVQLEKHEQKRANEFKGNKKIRYIKPEEDPILNDFKREMMFHRQAQAAVIEANEKLNKLGIPFKRPDDYFAEMLKSDEHMQKVRSNLIAKQEGQAKSERIRQIREQRKMGKLLAKQARVQKEMDKKEMLDQVKKFRKGKLKNLDFLEESKNNIKKGNKKTAEKRNARNKKFGFGGKKKGMKRNTKDSASSMDNAGKAFRKPGKGAKGKAQANKRPGKSRRAKAGGGKRRN